jgi:hypothetical protein
MNAMTARASSVAVAKAKPEPRRTINFVNFPSRGLPVTE